MPFGYKYWMVFLPQFSSKSFLLFVHNPSGSTKLRDYSTGTEKVLGQPRTEGVLGATTEGRTRFFVDPHETTDAAYWRARTEEHNRRYLTDARRVMPLSGLTDLPSGQPPEPAARRHNGIVSGPALRGSRWQIQQYVNNHGGALSTAVLDVLPARLRELGVAIQWVSPLAEDDFVEYRDADFLRAVGLEEAIPDLKQFWPSSGPSWDALGRVSDANGRIRPGALLVEAKSHLAEIYGNGCQAQGASRNVITKALTEAKAWCRADGAANWTGPLYQSANRLAHLYFLRERVKHLQRPAWLINIYFLDDPIGPADRESWDAELVKVKSALGLIGPVPCALDVFLPALPVSVAASQGGD